jgi:hypothetical protein
MRFRLKLIDLEVGGESRQEVLAEEAVAELVNNPSEHALGDAAEPEPVTHQMERWCVVETEDNDSAKAVLTSALTKTHRAHGIHWDSPTRVRTDALETYRSISPEQMLVEEIPPTDDKCGTSTHAIESQRPRDCLVLG